MRIKLHREKSVNSDPNLSDHPLSCWDVCVCVNDRYINTTLYTASVVESTAQQH